MDTTPIANETDVLIRALKRGGSIIDKLCSSKVAQSNEEYVDWLMFVQEHCISCADMRCDTCCMLMSIYCKIVYLTTEDLAEVGPDVVELAEERDASISLPERRLQDRRAYASLRASWVISKIDKKFEFISVEDIGELPGALPEKTVASIIHYLVGDDADSYRRVWAIRSALRNTLDDICFHMDRVDKDHCSVVTRNIQTPTECTRIFTEDSEPPSVVRFTEGGDNTRFSANVLVAMCDIAKKAFFATDVRILLLTYIHESRDGDMMAFKLSEDKSLIGFLRGNKVICCDPASGGIDLFNAFIYYHPKGDDIRRAIEAPSDDGTPISIYFERYHTEKQKTQ